jgi:hypothetical protein
MADNVATRLELVQALRLSTTPAARFVPSVFFFFLRSPIELFWRTMIVYSRARRSLEHSSLTL